MNDNIKMVEIRDRATLIAAYAIKMVPTYPGERFLMKNAGYGFSHPCVMLVPIQAPWLSLRHSSEAHENSTRTLLTAHKYIEENFDNIQPCDVIDVEFILGEVHEPCKSAQEEMKEEMEEELKKILSELENKDEPRNL